MELIAQLNGDGASNSLEFTNIPQTYKHLQLYAILYQTTGLSGNFELWLNSEAGANHRSIVADFDAANTAGVNLTDSYPYSFLDYTTGSRARIFYAEINDYTYDTASSSFTTRPIYVASTQLSTSTSYPETQFGYMENDSNTGPITSLELAFGRFPNSDSKVFLYGIG